jgi:hypothetical protein
MLGNAVKTIQSIEKITKQGERDYSLHSNSHNVENNLVSNEDFSLTTTTV